MSIFLAAVGGISAFAIFLPLLNQATRNGENLLFAFGIVGATLLGVLLGIAAA